MFLEHIWAWAVLTHGTLAGTPRYSHRIEDASNAAILVECTQSVHEPTTVGELLVLGR
jgi:hypothetical protein